ncbi:putative peptidylprolyl isomerase [Medicago truncatula]|uniref:peptidylprolyl isomerase n=1 Tax=Medicago truncatula TaxID=3880 RepID=A0A396GB37_MEDTR|nr:putative peptidylprolyl isomerase [Medicago truncatula]
MPLSNFKKKVEYTNPIRKYNEMIGSTSSGISFLVLTEPEDICKDGGLVKKILKPGDDKYQHVDDYVLVKYEARLDDGTLVKKSDDYGVEFTLNDGQLVVLSLPTTFIIHTTLLYFPFPGRSYIVLHHLIGHFCPALSIAIKTMKIGEKVILTVKPQYGFGDKGKPAHHDEGSVPPNATLQIILEFVSWKE